MWVLSKLQETISGYTCKLGGCDFNLALATIEDFIIETLSRLYVPMVRKELWTDDPETLKRRQTIYAVLHHVLKTVTLLLNPVAPYLSEALYQRVYRKLAPEDPESINLHAWPEPDENLRDKLLEQTFETLFEAVSLVNAARQNAKLKRRWPLQNAIVTAPAKVVEALQKTEALFIDLANVKTVTFTTELPPAEACTGFASAQDGEITVYVSPKRDETLIGEGIMRDLARRVQALRKELGFKPTDILDAVRIAGLDQESITLATPHMNEMTMLIRAKKVTLQKETTLEPQTKWHETELDGKKIHIAIVKNETPK